MRIIPRRTVGVSWQELKAALRVLFKGRVLSGWETADFEKKFADYLGVDYAIALPSARAGLWAVFKNLGFDPGDEVIMSAYNFPVIPNLVKTMGLNPIFVDSNPETLNIDPFKIGEKVTKRSRYILVTHMYGQPADIDKIKEIAFKCNLKIIEDCAHACVAVYKEKKVGSFGQAGCFSFGIGKGLVSFGGGMLTTDNYDLYSGVKKEFQNLPAPMFFKSIVNLILSFLTVFFTKRIPYIIFVFPLTLILGIFNIDIEEFLDSFTRTRKSNRENLPFYCRNFTNIQAAIGMEQLRKIDELNNLRISNSESLSKSLSEFAGKRVQIKKNNTIQPVYLYYPFRVKDAARLKKFLLRRGIDSKLSFQKDCSGFGSWNDEIIELPNSYNLANKDIDYIAKIIKFYCRKEL